MLGFVKALKFLGMSCQEGTNGAEGFSVCFFLMVPGNFCAEAKQKEIACHQSCRVLLPCSPTSTWQEGGRRQNIKTKGKQLEEEQRGRREKLETEWMQYEKRRPPHTYC